VEALSKGKQRSSYDLMIAATAAATNRILLTTDAKAEFNQLPGVRSEVIPVP
jgi:tRNA(fMet)-specific endonuclease VapC